MQLFTRLRDFFRRLFAQGGASRSPLHLAQRQVLTVRGNRAVPSIAQWRELPRYLSQGEKRIFAFALIGVILTAGILSYRFLTSHQTTVAAVGGSYTEGLIGTPQFINPLYSVTSDTDTDLTRLVFSGLMRFDPNHGLSTDLAESYTVSEDQKTYTFVLRPDARWHDDNPVTAQDVVFTIQAIQNPEYHSPLAVSFAGVSVQMTDERTITFTLGEPFAPFLSTLTVGILPSHLWQQVPPSSALLAPRNLDPIGSGPYMHKQITKDQNGTIRKLILVRNDAFYRGAPNINELTFKFYRDADDLAEALKNRNVEGAGFVPFVVAQSLTDDRLQSISPRLSQFTAAFFNSSHAPSLKDESVRNALILATDRTTLVNETLHNQSAVITSPILPTMPGYDAAIGATPYDLTQANTLLDKAGWTIPEGAAIRQKDSAKLALTMTIVDTPELAAVATALQQQWLRAGVELTIVAVDAATLQNDVLRKRNYDILLTGELYGADQDPYAFWHSSQVAYPGLNLAQFAIRKADDAIETARETTDPALRAESYKTLATLIAESYPAVLLYQPTYTYFTTNRIQNINLPAITVPADRFANVNEWYIKTRKVLGSTEESPQ